MNSDENQLLHREIEILGKSAQILKHSYDVCKDIDLKKECSLADLDRLEALTSRFARLNDIVIRKMFRSIDRLDIEPDGTVRDSINRAEKKGLIDSADWFVKIHSTVHEYLLEDINPLYRDVLVGTPILLDVVERIRGYCKRYH